MEIDVILGTLVPNLFFFGSLTVFVGLALLRVWYSGSPPTTWYHVLTLLLVGIALLLLLAEIFWPGWLVALGAAFVALASAVVRFFLPDGNVVQPPKPA